MIGIRRDAVLRWPGAVSLSGPGRGSDLEVNAFRLVVALLPQLLTLMLVGARFDLLGGLNRTDTGIGILMLLFVLTPIATAVLLVVEIRRRRLRITEGAGQEPGRPGGMVKLAAALLLQSLALNLVILSQLRMH
jgi:hypothetical protein